MIEIQITLDHINQARDLAKDLGIIKNSFTNGHGNLYGFVGEVIVNDYLGVTYNKNTNTKDYDLIYNGHRIEIKTKKCTSAPKEDYLCSVANTSLHQNCDYYVFIRVSANLDKSWICGIISKKELLSAGFSAKKGDLDGKNGFSFKVDCQNIAISKLKSIKDIGYEKTDEKSGDNSEIHKTGKTKRKRVLAKRDGNRKKTTRKVSK